MRTWIVGAALVGCGGGGPGPPLATPVPAARPDAPTAPAPTVTPAAAAQIEPWPGLNLDFERASGEQPLGWQATFAPQVVAVDDVKHGGQRSIRLRSTEAGPNIAPYLHVPADPVRGKHLKLHGWMKTDGVKGSAALTLRVDGGGGAFDGMTEHAIRGTSDWAEYAVEVDVPLKAEAVFITPWLIGQGTAWFDDLWFEVTESRPRTITLEGTIVDVNGTPVAGAVVALKSDMGLQRHTRSNEAGRFHFDAAAGKWGFSAHHPGMVGGFVDIARFDEDRTSIRVVLGGRGGVVVHGRLGPGKPAPDSYVAVTMPSEHDGDTFAVPVAGDGTFEATLPRADEYSAKLVEGGLGEGTGKRSGDRAEISIPMVALSPPPSEVVDWIGAHAIALSTTEAGHGFDDIAPIARIVGNARIVALGEATHGTREFFQLKHRVLEYLVSRHGFSLFAIEANEPECRAINDYVLHGIGDPRAALDGIYFWVWNTEEVLAMIEWMRAWNAEPMHRTKVQFVGFDMQTPRVAYGTVAAYLNRIRPNTAAGLLAPIEVLGMLPVNTSASSLSDSDRSRITKGVSDGLAEIARAFDRNRRAWMTQTGERDLQEARHDVTILQQATDLYLADLSRATGVASGFSVRDRAMAANIQWILERHPPSTRMVVWAHNLHVANRADAFENMGSHLRRRFKASFVNLGFVFSQGSFRAVQEATDGRLGEPREIHVGPPSESHASVAFALTGKPILALDLRELPKKGTVHDWFVAPHLVRDSGSIFWTEPELTGPKVLPDLYDAVIFVENTTPSRPNHPRR